MESYKEEFIEFMVRSNVLTFGDFITKSGRSTPFFINTGNYENGEQLLRLGQYYAKTIMSTIPDGFDVLYGPAYKGIPLVVSTAMVLHSDYGKKLPFCFNRKEVKDHGEGGNIIGHKLKDGERILIIEDVTTAGTSVRESIPLLKAAADVSITALIVSVNRMEKGGTEKSALDELQDEFKISTLAIVTLSEIISHLHNKEIDGRVVLDDVIFGKIEAYRNIYGADI